MKISQNSWDFIALLFFQKKKSSYYSNILIFQSILKSDESSHSCRLFLAWRKIRCEKIAFILICARRRTLLFTYVRRSESRQAIFFHEKVVRVWEKKASKFSCSDNMNWNHWLNCPLELYLRILTALSKTHFRWISFIF